MPERKKLLLRLDPRVYDAVAKWAADDLRSVNAQIEYALRLALRSAGREPHQRAPDESAGREPHQRAPDEPAEREPHQRGPEEPAGRERPGGREE
jgi:hypothetical protein